MNWWRRIRLYLTGFGLGIIICLILFRGRDLTSCTPTNRITGVLSGAKELTMDSTLSARLKSKNISEEQFRVLLRSGEVDFDKSQPRKEPCREYLIRFEHQGAPVGAYFSLCMQDSTATLLYLEGL